MIGHFEGDANEVGQPLAIRGTAGLRFDALQRRQSLFGVFKTHFLEASEQFETLEHGVPLPRQRNTTFRLRLGGVV